MTFALTFRLTLPEKITVKEVKKWAFNLQVPIEHIGGELILLNIKELKENGTPNTTKSKKQPKRSRNT